MSRNTVSTPGHQMAVSSLQRQIDRLNGKIDDTQAPAAPVDPKKDQQRASELGYVSGFDFRQRLGLTAPAFRDAVSSGVIPSPVLSRGGNDWFDFLDVQRAVARRKM
jgi:hypothetical protein